MSLDVKGVMDDGYHEMKMIIQGIKLHDKVKIKTLHKDAGGIKISLGVNKWYLPKDEKNIAYKAALLIGFPLPYMFPHLLLFQQGLLFLLYLL